MFKPLKESYINISNKFYGPDFINYTNVVDGKVALDERTRFLPEKIKEDLNKDPLQSYRDAVYIVQYENVHYLIFDYDPSKDIKHRVKTHELVLPDTVQGMTSNLHLYNTEAEPILLTYNDSLSLEKITQEMKFSDVYSNDFMKVYIYQGVDAQKIIQKVNGIECFYLADGHHRLFVTELTEHKNSVLTALTSIKDLSIHSIGRKIPNVGPESMKKALDFLEKRDMLTECKELKKGVIHLYWNEQKYSVKLVDLEGDSFWNNDVYRFNTQVLSQAFGIYKSENALPLCKNEEGNHDKEVVYVYFYPMEATEFIEVVSKNSILPPKSTYFAPKFPSNFILKRFK